MEANVSEDIFLNDLKHEESSAYSNVNENEYELIDCSIIKQNQPPVLPIAKVTTKKYGVLL